jgi:hypothetical protein
MFEIKQTDHEPDRERRSTDVRGKALGESQIKPPPVDLVGQDGQGMVEIEELSELSFEEIELACGRV